MKNVSKKRKLFLALIFLPYSYLIAYFRSSHPEVFFGKGVLKTYSKSTGCFATLLKSHFGMGVLL